MPWLMPAALAWSMEGAARALGGLGRTAWVIPEGYLPEDDRELPRELASHGAICIVNTGVDDAHVELTLLFSEREPAGPYGLVVGGRRAVHARLNELKDPEEVPRGTPFATVVRSDRAVVVQHTRLDARAPGHSLMTTMAYPAEG